VYCLTRKEIGRERKENEGREGRENSEEREKEIKKEENGSDYGDLNAVFVI
jgi:hypothetical protein